MKIGLFCIALAITGGTLHAAAAEYPARPIRFIVPSAPGGTPDIIVVRKEVAKWADVVKRTGAKVD